MAWLNPLAGAQLTSGRQPADGNHQDLADDPQVHAYLAECLATLNEGA
jgi:hypothetical protein